MSYFIVTFLSVFLTSFCLYLGGIVVVTSNNPKVQKYARKRNLHKILEKEGNVREFITLALVFATVSFLFSFFV